MKQIFDRDGAIERYVNGTMPPAEQKEFMSRLEWDAGLRRAVDAELLIRTSVQTSRTSVPSPSPDSRARFLTMLATVAPEPAAVSMPDPATTAATAGKGGSLMNALTGSGIVKGVLATVASVAVTIGTIVVIPDSPDREGTREAKQGNAPAQMAQPAPALPELPAENSTQLQAEPAGTLPAEAIAPEATAPETSLRQSRTAAETPARGTAVDLAPASSTPMTATRTAATSVREKSGTQATEKQAPRETATVSDADQNTSHAPDRQDIPVVKENKVPVTIGFKDPKIKK